MIHPIIISKGRIINLSHKKGPFKHPGLFLKETIGIAIVNPRGVAKGNKHTKIGI